MITIEDLKNFLNTLPAEFNSFSISNGEFSPLGDDKEFYYRLDRPILSLYIDEEHKEMCFLHQSEEEVAKIEEDSKNFVDNNEKLPDETANDGKKNSDGVE